MTPKQIKKAKKLVNEELLKIVESKIVDIEEIKKKLLAGLEMSESEYKIADFLPLFESIVNKKYKELIPALESIKETMNKEFPVDYENIKNKPNLEEYRYDDKEIVSKINDNSSKIKKIVSKIKTQGTEILKIDKKKVVMAHDELKRIGPNDHHDEKHLLESHSESELLTKVWRLVSGENVDDLHKHKTTGLTRTNQGLWNPMHFHDDVYYKKNEVIQLIADAVSTENLFDRIGTVISPHTIGDSLDMGTGAITAEHLKTTDDLEVGNDILLGSGSVLNWNSGNITLTHSANILTFTGMSSFDLGLGNLTTTGKGEFGSTYQAVLGDSSKAGYFSDGTNYVDIAGLYYNIYSDVSGSAGAKYAFYGTDGTHTLQIADGSQSLQAGSGSYNANLVNTSSGYAGYFTDGTNSVYIADGSYAINTANDINVTGTIYNQADNSKHAFGAAGTTDSYLQWNSTGLDIYSSGGIYNFITAADTDITLNFIGTTNSGQFKWMEDEDYFQFMDDILMNSTEAIYFRDTAIHIASLDDGRLDLTADESIDINSLLRTRDVQPLADNTYYLGKNDDDSPLAYKGVILRDTTNGKYYRIEVISGTITATDLTD